MSWPYGDPPEPFLDPATPTWQCPGDNCVCHPIEIGGEQDDVSIVLLAEDGARMPRAACRVHYQGRIINTEPNADGDGRVKMKLPRVPTTLFVEWAPENTPLEPRYPYRARYFVDLGPRGRESGRRRLHNLGFWTERTLEDNVRAFQRRYDHPEDTGKIEDIQHDLEIFHDQGCPPITKGKDDPGFEKASFAPSPVKAKQGVDDKTPQAPLPPAPNQGSVKVPAVEVDIVIDWGFRPARAGKAAQPSSSFWLEPADSPVKIGVVDTLADAWATDKPSKDVPVKFKPGSKTAVIATLPPGPVLLRVEFDLQIEINSNKKTVLAFRQLYFLEADGNLLDSRFAFEEGRYSKGAAPKSDNPDEPPARRGSPPVRTNTGKFRIGRGEHPLLWHDTDLLPPDPEAKGPKKKDAVPRRTKRIFVNAEMVDATELWWAVHPEEDIEQYLHPGLLGRTDNLRILAWTRGKNPMIWFALVPDAALARTEKTAADIVFIRPPPGANSFPYDPTMKGFTAAQHRSTTMQMLARYVLGSRTLTALRGAGVTDDTTLRAYADQIPPSSPLDPAPGTVSPDKPAPFISMFPISFRPCWLEDSVNRAGAPNVLLLPLGTPDHGYPGTMEPGLKTVTESAFLCLWTMCAVARDLPESPIRPNLDDDFAPVQKPNVAARKLWLIGHSRGNTLMGAALVPNAREVDRVLTFSATPVGDNLEPLIANIGAAVAARKKDGKKLDVFVISAPDMTGDWDLATTTKGKGKDQVKLATKCRGASMDVQHARRLVATGASVTFLPAFDKQRAHYTLAPAKDMLPFLHNMVSRWTDEQIEISASTPHDWQFLFFHEYPVFGGDLDTTTTPPTFRPFFLQAFGAPNPLTTVPSKIP